MHRTERDEHRAHRNRRSHLARGSGSSGGGLSARGATSRRSLRRIMTIRAGRTAAEGRRGFLSRGAVHRVYGEVPPQPRILLRVWLPALSLRIPAKCPGKSGAGRQASGAREEDRRLTPDARHLVPRVPVVSAFGPVIGWTHAGVADRRHALDVLDAVFHRNRQAQRRAVLPR